MAKSKKSAGKAKKSAKAKRPAKAKKAARKGPAKSAKRPSRRGAGVRLLGPKGRAGGGSVPLGSITFTNPPGIKSGSTGCWYKTATGGSSRWISATMSPPAPAVSNCQDFGVNPEQSGTGGSWTWISCASASPAQAYSSTTITVTAIAYPTGTEYEYTPTGNPIVIPR